VAYPVNGTRDALAGVRMDRRQAPDDAMSFAAHAHTRDDPAAGLGIDPNLDATLQTLAGRQRRSAPAHAAVSPTRPGRRARQRRRRRSRQFYVKLEPSAGIGGTGGTSYGISMRGLDAVPAQAPSPRLRLSGIKVHPAGICGALVDCRNRRTFGCA
jgi:hypothetical protein